MSHIIFGDFHKSIMSEETINKIKKELYFDNILIYFDKEINFNKEVVQMLAENFNIYNNRKFCITSISQKYNSEDLLFPYDIYSQEDLFPDGGR